MRLTVIGTGYLGLTHAVCMADLGHDVMGLDVDADKVARASNGDAPFFEPGLEPLLRKNLEAGRLRFTTSFAEVAEFGDVHFLCVNTPQAAGGEADLRHIHSAADALAPHLWRPCLVAGKSTVPVGTARSLADLLRQVYGKLLEAGTPALVMDLETAELVKVSANAFLATKISFINAMAEICEKAGADVVRLADALARDDRIGKRFLAPGLGFGGGCLPKDIRAFQSTARELGVESVVNLLGEVDAINLGRRSRVIELARDVVGGILAGRRLAVLGLAFKPDSDDVRDSPSLHVCGQLLREGALVSVHDPVAMGNAARIQPGLRYAGSVSEAAAGADAVLHLTEWADYRLIDPAMLATVVAQQNMIDARCALDEDAWRSAGWSFRVLGREHRCPAAAPPV